MKTASPRPVRWCEQCGKSFGREKRLESAGTNTTDDRGQYRIYGLLPGQFVVCAQPRNQGLAGLGASIATEIEAAVQQMAQMMGGGPPGRVEGEASVIG